MSITTNTFSCPIVYSMQYNNLTKNFFEQKNARLQLMLQTNDNVIAKKFLALRQI